jgi:outer membrane receptor for ferrienterochelin and colicins
MTRAPYSREKGSGVICAARACSISRLFLFLLAGFTAAHAESPDIMDMSLEQLKSVQVSSASMFLQSEREAPSSVTVITAAQIRQFGYRTLADILRSVRGFNVTYDRNYTYVSTRGFTRIGDYNDQILLLINGFRMNDNVYESAQLGTEFPLDISLIQRIEIVRGPSSSLYGTSAFLGIINVITKRPQDAPGMELSAAAGDLGSYWARTTIGGAYHGVQGLVSGTLYDSAGASRLFFPAFDAPETNYGIARDADRDSSQSFMGSLQFQNFTLEALGSSRDKGIPTASFGQVFNDNRSQTTDSTAHLDLQYSRTVFHDTELATSVYFDRALYHGIYVYPPVDGQTTDVLNEDSSRGDRIGANARVSRTLRQHHKATAGVEFQDNLRQDQTNYNLNPFQPVLDDRRSSNQWALYAQDEFTIRKGLILNAGLRHDQYYSFGGATDPRLALIYSPRTQSTFKLIYGQAFRAPNAYELYYGDQVSSEPNLHLRPETIHTEELIWEQGLGGNFRLSIGGFGNQFNNLIEQQTDSRSGLIVFRNSQRVNSRGMELEFGGKLPAGVEGRASYTFQRTEDPLTGRQLSGLPAHLVKANLVYPIVHRSLRFGIEMQFSGSRNTLDGEQVGRYAVSNVTLSTREFARGSRISASIYNIFNSPYSDTVGAEIVESTVRQNGRDFRIQILHTFHVQ